MYAPENWGLRIPDYAGDIDSISYTILCSLFRHNVGVENCRKITNTNMLCAQLNFQLEPCTARLGLNSLLS